jgi:hypothetical protein
MWGDKKGGRLQMKQRISIQHLSPQEKIIEEEEASLDTHAITGKGFSPAFTDTSKKPIMGEEVCHGETQDVLSGVQARSGAIGLLQ